MVAEIISIGDELLIGQTVNTNSTWMAQQLSALGVSIHFVATIRDNENDIIAAIQAAEGRADLILITGGLGPTNDDITKETLCKYFNTELEMNEEVLNEIDSFFQSRGLSMLPVNRMQAMLPKACTVLKNKRGTASGMLFEKEDKKYVSLPGVPYEMKGLMSEFILPMLQSDLGDEVMHRTIRTIGIGESFLAEIINDWEDALRGEGIKLAYLPSPGIVKLRLTLVGKDKETCKQRIDHHVRKLYQLIPEFIYGEGEEELHEIVGNLLKDNRATMATAESCTGGNIAHLITSVSGSSDYYKGSIVSYANEIKRDQLGVLQSDLDKYGAVSEVIVKQMVQGILDNFKVDYAIATSGIAGPLGGTEDKPVGTVWIAVANKHKVIAKKFIFGKNRSRNIDVSSKNGLNMLRLLLEGKENLI